MQAEDAVKEANQQPLELTPKEHNAILALLEHPSIRKAAEAAGIGEATLFRWLLTTAPIVGGHPSNLILPYFQRKLALWVIKVLA